MTGEPRAPRAGLGKSDTVLLLTFAVFALMLASHAIVFGSERGRVVYPIIYDLNAKLLLGASLAAACAASMLELGLRFVDRRPGLIVGTWIAGASAFHLVLRALYPISMGHIVESDLCTSFYSVALRFGPRDVLRRYLELAPHWPVHAHTNLPGKTLMFDLLQAFTTDPGAIAVIIVLASNVGGLLVYALVQRWFGSRTISLTALVLYLLFPARIAFFPQPNVISPLLILGALLCFTLFLDSRRSLWLWILGALLYAVVLFDPLTLSLGLVFLGLIVQRLARGDLPAADLWKLVLHPAGAFLASYVAMRLGFGFDLWAAYRYAMDDLEFFNALSKRPYGVWLVHNPKEFLITAGLLVSAVTVAGAWRIAAETVRRARVAGSLRALRELLADPGPNLLTAVVLSVVALVVVGINRGEVTRLWIFLAVALQMAAAWLLVERYDRATTRLVVASLAFETVLLVRMVGFMLC